MLDDNLLVKVSGFGINNPPRPAATSMRRTLDCTSANYQSPFILPVGGTVEDMARYIHNDMADNLKHARIWGGTLLDSQQVTGQHVLTDRNIVELHV